MCTATSTSVNSIYNLSHDAVLIILKMCSLEDILSFGSTCHHFREIICAEVLWKFLCSRDYGVNNKMNYHSYRSLYSQFLNKYGKMKGLYQVQIGPICALVEVKVEASSIVGIEWEAKEELSTLQPLGRRLLFSITAEESQNSENPEISITCCPESPDPHDCTLEEKSRGVFIQKCCSIKQHLNIVRQMMSSNGPYPDFERASTMKVIFLNSVLEDDGLIHKPLLIPNKQNVPHNLLNDSGNIFPQVIDPGLFKGNYDEDQGVQLLLFKFKNDEDYEIEGRKVTGDTKVPAGKISVRVNLRFPVSPSELQQRSLGALKQIEPHQSKEPISSFSEQPFFLPEDIRPVKHIPNSCKARYHGFGQIADSGFEGPIFSPIHVVIFNNNMMGVIWLELNYLSIFQRIHINFESHCNKNVRLDF